MVILVVEENKKLKILLAATHLFAEKGFFVTSVQEIAEYAGISKGSIYLYFKSKDEILLSIFEYHHEQLLLSMQKVNVSFDEDSKIMLSRQIEAFLLYMFQNSDFLKIYLRGEGLLKKEILTYLKQIRLMYFKGYQDKLNEWYGNQLQDYSSDCAVILDGLIEVFLKWNLFDNSKPDIQQISIGIVERFEFMVQGILAVKPNPMIEADYFSKKINETQPHHREEIHDWIVRITNEVDHLHIKKSEKARLLDVLATLDKDVRGVGPNYQEKMLDVLKVLTESR